MEAEERAESESSWRLARCCPNSDRGTQRCRLPLHMARQLDVCLGDVLLVERLHTTVVVTVHLWPEQQDNILQLDTSVQIPNNIAVSDTGTTNRCVPTGESFSPDVVLPLTSFKKVRSVGKLSEVVLDLVLDTYADCKLFNSKRQRYLSLLPAALSRYVLMPGCQIDCQDSNICRIMRVAYVVNCRFDLDGAGRATSKTRVSVGRAISRERYKNLAAQRPVPALGGLDGPRRLLQDVISYPFRFRSEIAASGIRCPRGVLLAGPPGTGKTALVQSVVQMCGASLIKVAGPELCRSEPGESEAALRRIFGRAVALSEEGPCVLFVDEVDSVLAGGAGDRQASKGGQQTARLRSQMLTLMDGMGERGDLVVIGATNRPQILDPAVRRPGRFDHEIYLGAPSKENRQCILKLLTAEFVLDADVNLANLAEWTPGFVGADLVMSCQEVASSKIYSSIDQSSHPSPITESDFRESLKMMRPSTLRGNNATNDYQRIRWDEIGGLDDIKRQLVQAVEWPMKHKAAFLRLGLRQPRGVLLYGPPGCCKTTLVRACATSCNSTFLHVSSAHIYSSYLGDSEKAIVEVFHRGRIGAPTILFLDEIDAIVGKRDIGSSRGVHEKVLSTLLNEMDGIGITFASKQGTSGHDANKSDSVDSSIGDVIVIAATNRPDLLDDAILRPGRFDKMIYVPPPDDKTRLQIFDVLTKKMPVAECDFNVLVQKTEGFTGADLENLCREAALQALTESGLDCISVQQEHFFKALANVEPSVSPEQLRLYEKHQQRDKH